MVGIGNSLVDILVQIESDSILAALGLPKGSMNHIDEARLGELRSGLSSLSCVCASGGSAANTMKALASLGTPCAFVGKIAGDEPGCFYERDLRARGVETRFVHTQEGNSGIAITFVSPDGQRTFATYLGVSGTLCAADVTEGALRGAGYLYMEGYLVQNHALVLHTLALAKQLGLTVCLDLASYNIVEADRDFFHQILADYVDIVFANSEEATAFTGLKPTDAVSELARLCSIAVVKLGADGACAESNGEFCQVPALSVPKVVDTTGAGDCFAAGFLHALLGGNTLPDCLAAGSRLAARIIQVMGATLPDK